MRVLVVVSPDKSDVFFANQLMKFLNVVGVVVENQTPERDRSSLIKRPPNTPPAHEPLSAEVWTYWTELSSNRVRPIISLGMHWISEKKEESSLLAMAWRVCTLRE